MTIFTFDERYAFSVGRRQAMDVRTIQAMIPCCASVTKTSNDKDRSGVDYIAKLESGRLIGIDAKARETRPGGIARFWKHGSPEVALEIWSVMEQRVNGWTCDDRKQTEMVLFTFDPKDCTDAYLIGYQGLRLAFRKYLHEWMTRYRHPKQRTSRPYGPPYTSQCIFVPIDEVHRAIASASRGKLVLLPSELSA